jgi:serine/threonine-protein kinase RsbW
MPVFNATPDLSSLARVRDFVLSCAARAGMAEAAATKLDLVLEEAIVNVVHHAYKGQEGSFEVECQVRDNLLCCTVRDWGAEFNPLTVPPADTTGAMDDRPIGGLGLLFVNTMPDHTSYTRNGNANELTLCFALRQKEADA